MFCIPKNGCMFVNRYTHLMEPCYKFPVDCAWGFVVDCKVSIKDSTAYQSCQPQSPTEHGIGRLGMITYFYMPYTSVSFCFYLVHWFHFILILFIMFIFIICVAIVSVVLAEGSARSGWIDRGADGWRTFGSDPWRTGAPLDSTEETPCGYPSCHRTVLLTNH